MADQIVLDARSLSYEESLLRDQYNIKQWWAYLEYRKDAAGSIRYVIYERAVRALPGSYKLWYQYLQERVSGCKDLCISSPEYEHTSNAYERCLVHLHKMPRIWKEYLEFLIRRKLITLTRHTFDRALQALPATQHQKWIWPTYLNWARNSGVPELALRVYRRYLKIEPSEVETLVKFLKHSGRLNEAAQYLADMVNDETFVSKKGRSKHDIWTELLTVITKNPDKVNSLNVDAIIRSGIRRFPHEVGRLWTSLADYYIRLGHFEKARDVYEEGITTVATVRDFSIVFDAYARYEESMLTAKMEAQAEEVSPDLDEEDVALQQIELDMRLARLEDLMSRRPLLLSSVLLRQNPHNVDEWLKRVQLFANDPEKAILTFTEAVTTVDPAKATGKLQTLWTKFATFYEGHEDLDNARAVFDKATQVNFRTVDALATVWCEYVEMELRHSQWQRALEVIRRACIVPRHEIRTYKKGGNETTPVQQRLYKSTRLWTLYADLEENFGTLETTKAVYESMIDIKVVTPAIIINYANLMEQHNFFEESYRVFEKGIALFGFPHVEIIWVAYLKRFIQRYKGKKIERTRDLFEQAVEKVPAKDSKKLYLLYAKFEEDYGLARRAMDVYARACAAATQADRYEMYLIYIHRCAIHFGATKTREIYDKSIKVLPDSHARDMCLRYASLERHLGEIDRARAIYFYASQFCDPRIDVVFWKTWSDFEIAHGNQDTFKDMLRIRRTVQTQYSASASLGSNAALAKLTQEQEQREAEGKKRKEPGDAIQALEAANPEEIELDEEGQGGEEEGEEGEGEGPSEGQDESEAAQLSEAHIGVKSVPDAVFGLEAAAGTGAGAALGAKERFAQAK